MMIEARGFLPVGVVFHPHWWHEKYGFKFTKEFFTDPEVRVESERRMRHILHERFGDLGLGEEDAQPRPVVGPVHHALGYVLPAILGCEVEYLEDRSPQVITANMSDEQVLALEVPDIQNTSPMKEIIAMMDALEDRFGYLEGDINWEGVQNIALYLRGNQLFLDYYSNPELARRLMDVIVRTIVEVATYVRSRTGTTSITVNPSIAGIDPRINLHSNCSVTMISNETYEEFLLDYDNYLAERLQPYGIHHCGDNMEHVNEGFAKVTGCEFFDVGWGSDVAACREALPDAWFNLRLSPVKLMTCSPQDVKDDVERLLRAAGPLEKASVCCINMDDGTPDENVRAIFEVVERYRGYGG